MASLLDKTRQISKLVQTPKDHPVDFEEMADVLSQLILANVYLVSREGKIWGYSLCGDFECAVLRASVLEDRRFPEGYSRGLLKVNGTLPNITQDDGLCVFASSEECIAADKVTTVVPINGAGERLGTLLLARFGKDFEEEDLVLTEFGATVAAMEILRYKGEKVEEEARKKAAVQIAIGTLSFSELEAVQHIFEELDGDEGLLVASKIADRVGITRSVIVNALRKFESAGVIESRSLGMKGTYIRILNDRLLEELGRVRAR